MSNPVWWEAAMNIQFAEGHTFPDTRKLCLSQQPTASSQHGIKPITASDTIQPMPVSNQSPKLCQTAFSELIYVKTSAFKSYFRKPSV